MTLKIEEKRIMETGNKGKKKDNESEKGTEKNENKDPPKKPRMKMNI